MTNEERQLLIKDLAARLPYGVIVQIQGRYDDGEEYIRETEFDGPMFGYLYDDEKTIIPYLRPISSMTEEEMDKLFDILHVDKDGKDDDWIKINDVYGIKFFFPTGRWVEEVEDALSYLRSIHIDISGLIPKGLALEATEGMYTKK